MKKLILTTVLLLIVSVGYCDNTQGNLPSLERFTNKLKELVLIYYPEAKFIITDNSINFEYGTGTFMIDHFDKADGRGVTREKKGPKLGGILCEISLRKGKYSGAARSPQVFNYKHFECLLLTPYTARYDCYLHISLCYPENTSGQFIRYFTELVNNFELYFDIKNQPLQLTIKSDKQVYEIGEEINIEVSFKNVSGETKRVLLYDKPEKNWTVFNYTTLIIVPKLYLHGMFTFYLGEAYKSSENSMVGEYIKPNESLSYFIPVTQKIKKLYPNFDFSSNIYTITLQYGSPWNVSHVGYWTGSLTSNTITIEVVEKK